MSVEVLEESGSGTDLDRLARLSRFVLERLRVHPQAELCIKLVDAATITELNEQWMDKEGPTDVLAWPMDELRPGLVNEEPEEGVLGDLVVCPEVAARQADEARAAGRDGWSTGDVTQVDLPGGTTSGLRVVQDILTGVEDISFNRLTSHDVVRHRLVGRIVAAYDEFEGRDDASEAPAVGPAGRTHAPGHRPSRRGT